MTAQLLIVCPNLASGINAIPEDMKISVQQGENNSEAILVSYVKDIQEVRTIIQDYGGCVYVMKKAKVD